MKFGAISLGVLVCVCASVAEKWRWPENAGAVRVDSKVRFVDNIDQRGEKYIRNAGEQADEPQFEEPTNTEGFYNLPPGVGRYPVRIETPREPYRVDPKSVYNLGNSQHRSHYSDGTLDSLQYCKCVSSPDCQHSVDSTVSQKACGSGKYLCCYKRPSQGRPQHTEYFNEVEDERPASLPGYSGQVGPFSPPPGSVLQGGYRPDPHKTVSGINKPVLVGPGGPTGVIGPAQNLGVLVGPEGPTGVIGPKNQQVLVGPEGPTGVIGPAPLNKGVLVGPQGPTGVIGPNHAESYRDHSTESLGSSESAQRGVLVGPGGPTGIIGPPGYGRRPVLVGPGGPTGIIGPYGRNGRPLLVGPGGPTGIIGPRRRPYYI